MGAYGLVPHRAPSNLNASLAWSWHDERGRFATVLNGGVVIDDQRNLYTAAVDGLHKLSPAGELLWTRPGGYSAAPVLSGDLLYGSSKDGTAFAVDLESGGTVWSTKLTEITGADCHSCGLDDGVLVTPSQGHWAGGQARVFGLNASTGSILWSFSPPGQLWNFMPMFTGNGSVVFQDQLGGVYHLSLRDGRVLWEGGVRGGRDQFWTDGMSWLGPNGLFYAIHVEAGAGKAAPLSPSDLRAYRVSDGAMVWRRDFPYPANSQPVVAQLREGGGLSVVANVGLQAGVPVGFFYVLGTSAGVAIGCGLTYGLFFLHSLWRCSRPRMGKATRWACVVSALVSALAINLLTSNVTMHFPGMVQVLDAETGALQWQYEFPTWTEPHVRGDDEGLWTRLRYGPQPFCVPNGWGSPSVDSAGYIYLGHQNGLIYRLRDDDGDGQIGEGEFSTFDMGASSTHFGGAYAPGMMAWASCDSVFLFEDGEAAR